MSRPSVLVLCGGKSAERFVSLVSARCVVENLLAGGHAVSLVHIGVDGEWRPLSAPALLKAKPESLHRGKVKPSALLAERRSLDPWKLLGALKKRGGCVFPVVHGPMGEDGTLQGLFELIGVAYAGCGVLGSAAGMDKEATKRLAASAGVPQLPWAAVRTLPEARAATRRLGFPVFVKPASMGSSVGVSKVRSPRELKSALREALRYDDKALVEKGIAAREIEVALLGDPWAPRGSRFALKASVIGEIAPNAEFYDYNAKYLDPDGARLLVPAPLPKRTAARVKEVAFTAFRALALHGLARMDFFVDKRSGAVWFNEPNTLPGFTPISMYPMLWRKAGLPTPRLVATLVELGLRRARARGRLSADPRL